MILLIASSGTVVPLTVTPSFIKIVASYTVYAYLYMHIHFLCVRFIMCVYITYTQTQTHNKSHIGNEMKTQLLSTLHP